VRRARAALITRALLTTFATVDFGRSDRSPAEFHVAGFAAYYWISLYFVLICMSMTLGKHIMSSSKATIWGSVLLTNGLLMKAAVATVFWG